MEVTLWRPFFGTGEWEFVHEEYSTKLVYMGVGCLEMYVYVKRKLGMQRMECCASSLCQKMLAAKALGCADALCFVGRHRQAMGSVQHSFCVRTSPHGNISCSSI